MRKKLCIVIINYRRPHLTEDCLASLEGQVAGRADRHVFLIDNASGDDSVERLERVIAERGWGSWITFRKSERNGGFAYGNNEGFKAVDADYYLLLNSDARATAGALDGLLEAADEHPEAGLLGPRVLSVEGEPQVSCFRFRTPMSEFLQAAATGPIDGVFNDFIVAIEPPTQAMEPQWISFACVLVRREVVERVGLMDEDYFMYFEDIDYSRRIRAAGWTIRFDPRASFVHLHGGSSSVTSAMRQRKRVPRYYYESRSRYFAKYYGGVAGVLFTNMMWFMGRAIAWTREVVGNKSPHHCENECRDNWTNWLRPLRSPELPKGGEL